MLTVGADKRITAHQALEHPWMDLDDVSTTHTAAPRYCGTAWHHMS
jgi:hypothetical protein